MISPSGPPVQTLAPGLALGTVTLEIVSVHTTDSGIYIGAIVAERENQYCTTKISAFFERLPMEDDARLLRRGLKIMVCHEVDEQIKLNGYRIFDPHDQNNVERHY
jgi:hypothetical protein